MQPDEQNWHFSDGYLSDKDVSVMQLLLTLTLNNMFLQNFERRAHKHGRS